MALMVTQALATREPHTVQALLRALNRGLVDTVADPQAAINALAAHTNPIPGVPGVHNQGDVGGEARVVQVANAQHGTFCAAHFQL